MHGRSHERQAHNMVCVSRLISFTLEWAVDGRDSIPLGVSLFYPVQ
jgi:hypothetical protein